MCTSLVLTKMSNDLKQPETTYNEQETTWNNLQRTRNNLKRPTTTYNKQKMTSNNLKQPGNSLRRVRNDLKQPTMSKTQPTMTWPYLQWAKKRCETINNKQIFRLFYNMGQYVLFCNTFSTQNLVAIIRALLHRESWWK